MSAAPLDRTLGAGTALRRTRLHGACLRAGLTGDAASDLLGNALTCIAAGDASAFFCFLAAIEYRRNTVRVGMPRLEMTDAEAEALARALAAEMHE